MEVLLIMFFIQGGITSSDLATKALEARRAKVMGQALAGVPLWQLGPESRHPGVPYIVFPGNKHIISSPYQQINNVTFLLKKLSCHFAKQQVMLAITVLLQKWSRIGFILLEVQQKNFSL